MSKAPTETNVYQWLYNYPHCVRQYFFIFILFSFFLLIFLSANLENTYENIASITSSSQSLIYFLTLFSLTLAYFESFLYMYIYYFCSKYSILIPHRSASTSVFHIKKTNYLQSFLFWFKTDFSWDLLTDNHRLPKVKWWWTLPLVT